MARRAWVPPGGTAWRVLLGRHPVYEGSVVMRFDAHNHPVEYERLMPEQRQKAHRERCYKLVSVLHRRGPSYVYAAVTAPG